MTVIKNLFKIEIGLSLFFAYVAFYYFQIAHGLFLTSLDVCAASNICGDSYFTSQIFKNISYGFGAILFTYFIIYTYFNDANFFGSERAKRFFNTVNFTAKYFGLIPFTFGWKIIKIAFSILKFLFWPIVICAAIYGLVTASVHTLLIIIILALLSRFL